MKPCRGWWVLMFISSLWDWDITNGIDGECLCVIYAVICVIIRALSFPDSSLNVILHSLVQCHVVNGNKVPGICKQRSKWSFTARNIEEYRVAASIVSLYLKIFSFFSFSVENKIFFFKEKEIDAGLDAVLPGGFLIIMSIHDNRKLFTYGRGRFSLSKISWWKRKNNSNADEMNGSLGGGQKTWDRLQSSLWGWIKCFIV